MPKPHYNLVIASPGTSFEAEYVQSLVKTLAWLTENGLTYIFLNKYSSFVPSARELTAVNSFTHNWHTREIGAGEFTYDRVLWIDSDVVWGPGDVEKLFETDLAIVSGVCMTSMDGTIGAHFPDENGLPTKINKVELILHECPLQVGGVGFAFVMMKQGVFETMRRPWFQVATYQRPDTDFRTMLSEDFSWCVSAQAAGFDIWLHPLVNVGHIKPITLI
jgi:hypothetical protein